MSPNNLTRRGFGAAMGLGALARAAQTPRPNILWITCEDTGPHLHACGDDYSVTPHLDALCARGTIYRNAWSNAPVCAPARTTIISGMYPPSTGSENMRSMVAMPAGTRMFPQYLRDAGYYCTNNSKEDYNLAKPGKVWDDSSRRGHWRNRQPGQPFFSVFNFEITHESQIRTRPHQWVHDLQKVRIPAYHPDTREVREDWAQYYDNITTMDGQAGALLDDLRKDGLADDTIVFFYGDHGSGMPRSKRWPYNSGLNVSIVVHIPEKFRHLAAPEYRPGTQTGRLVGFVDLAPTVLSLAGLEPPAYYQGAAFLGLHNTPERPYNYGFRGRMDERYDLARTVRDKRYVYVRNYMPHKIYGQYIDYMFQTPTTRVWKKLYDEGKLNAAQSRFWQTKPPEELYDLTADGDEVRNLAGSPRHRATLERFRKAERELAAKVRDIGFVPEGEMQSRAKGSSPYDAGHDRAHCPLERITAAAELASSLKPADLPRLVEAFDDSDSAVRYWAIMGMLMRGAEALKQAHPTVEKALADSSPYVRIAAAETLGRYGTDAEAQRALTLLLGLAPADSNGVHVSLQALNAIDALGARAKAAAAELKKMPVTDSKADARLQGYGERVREHIVASLAG